MIRNARRVALGIFSGKIIFNLCSGNDIFFRTQSGAVFPEYPTLLLIQGFVAG